ncbi:MAG: DUF2726 domain-containing protein [Rhodoferax sp.]|nr:DUF2726 domain-containing protein [Rhodoferax sp.]
MPASIFFLIIVVILVLLIGKGLSGQKPQVGFRAKQFLTGNELEFLNRLERAIPEYRFHCQVAMGALIEPKVLKSDSKSYYRARGRFSQKIVDYVAQERSTGKIIAIIELDDRTHDSHKDKIRDEMVTSAGYRVVRWNSRQKPDRGRIRAELFAGGF